MELLNEYFESLVFQYAEEKQGYVLYAAAVNGLVGGDKMRCIIAFVPAHLGIQNKARLSNLPWKNLQARVCPKSTYKLSIQAWKPPLLNSDIPEVMLSVIKRDQNYSTYRVDSKCKENFPFEVLMINSPKKKTMYQYPNSMNLHWAIDQFSTVFNYIEDQVQLPYQSYPKNKETQVIFSNNEDSKNTNIEWI